MRFLILLLFFASSVSAQPLAVTNTFSNNTVADAKDINQNFSDIVGGVNEKLSVDSNRDNVVLANGLTNNSPDPESAAGVNSGRFQVAVGWNSLLSNTTGSENTAIGAWSMRLNTAGFENVAVGNSTLEFNTSGSYNIAVGSFSLQQSDTGLGNTATGFASVNANQGGQFNTAFGYRALTTPTNGEYNTAVGSAALAGYLFGAAAPEKWGTRNVAVGTGALMVNRGSAAGEVCDDTDDWDWCASGNTAVGFQTLHDNTKGYANVALGKWALTDNISGDGNVAAGFLAAGSNTVGKLNSAFGRTALASNIEGERNSAFGNAALGDSTGDHNTGIGNWALLSNLAGSQNTALGSRADVKASNYVNATAIGYEAIVEGSNRIQLGNEFVTGVYTAGAYYSNGALVTSDERLKTNISEIGAGLSLINDLNPVAYHRLGQEKAGVELGLIAQDVASSLKKHGLSESGMVMQPDEHGHLYLRYNDLLAPMIKAIQELDDASEAKDEQIARLEQRLKSQQEALLAIVQSQQEQIARLQMMVEHQFAMN